MAMGLQLDTAGSWAGCGNAAGLAVVCGKDCQFQLLRLKSIAAGCIFGDGRNLYLFGILISLLPAQSLFVCVVLPGHSQHRVQFHLGFRHSIP